MNLIRVQPTVRTPGVNLSERDAPRFLIRVRRSSYGERNVEVCPGEGQAGDEAGTRDQRSEMRMNKLSKLMLGSWEGGLYTYMCQLTAETGS